MKLSSKLFLACIVLLSLNLYASPSQMSQEDLQNTIQENPKDWTVLVYLNGHNNLDSYGAQDINEMETVGSSDRVNVVVQWASLKNKKTQRLYVTHDTTSSVKSKVVQTLPQVDMGDYKSLSEFIKWGMKNYPAKHYFVDVWNHGGGWHYVVNSKGEPELHPQDISWDDVSGHVITTEQLGVALRDAAAVRGEKIDLFGADACLMAMAEVVAELQDSVKVFAGSEEVEPGDGWDYAGFLKKWYESGVTEPRDVGAALAQTYFASYSGGSQGNSAVTFSVLDVEKLSGLLTSVGDLSSVLQGSSKEEFVKIKSAAQKSQSYTYSDYIDLADFATKLKAVNASEKTVQSLDRVLFDIQDVVVANYASGSYESSTGISIWFPKNSATLKKYAARYSNLSFNQKTSWIDLLKKIYE